MSVLSRVRSGTRYRQPCGVGDWHGQDEGQRLGQCGRHDLHAQDAVGRHGHGHLGAHVSQAAALGPEAVIHRPGRLRPGRAVSCNASRYVPPPDAPSRSANRRSRAASPRSQSILSMKTM
jgi:hypothetical protein